MIKKEDIDLQKLLDDVSSIEFNEIPYRKRPEPDYLIARASNPQVMLPLPPKFPNLRIFLEKIDYVRKAIQLFTSADFLDGSELEKDIKSSQSDKEYTFAVPLRMFTNDFFAYKILQYTIPSERLEEVIERIRNLENPTLLSVIENELQQESAYESRYNEAIDSINSKYDPITSEMKKQRVNGEVSESLAGSRRAKFEEARHSHRPFVSLRELEDVSEELTDYRLPERLNLMTSFGYNPAAGSYCRKKSLVELQQNNGVPKGMLFFKKTVITPALILDLQSIAEHDRSEIAQLAGEMTASYKRMGSFR